MSGPGQFLAKVVLQKSHSLSTLGCISASKELINCCFFDGHISRIGYLYYIYMCVCVCEFVHMVQKPLNRCKGPSIPANPFFPVRAASPVVVAQDAKPGLSAEPSSLIHALKDLIELVLGGVRDPDHCGILLLERKIFHEYTGSRSCGFQIS